MRVGILPKGRVRLIPQMNGRVVCLNGLRRFRSGLGHLGAFCRGKLGRIK